MRSYVFVPGLLLAGQCLAQSVTGREDWGYLAGACLWGPDIGIENTDGSHQEVKFSDIVDVATGDFTTRSRNFSSTGWELGDISFDAAIGKTFASGMVMIGGVVGTLDTATNEDIGPGEISLEVFAALLAVCGAARPVRSGLAGALSGRAGFTSALVGCES